MTSRATANAVAAVIFFVALVCGAFVLGRNHRVERPTTVTSVTKSAAAAVASSQKVIEVIHEHGKKLKTTTTTTKAATPATPKSHEVTSVHGGRSFAERILGNTGLVLVRVGLLLLAAFIAAATIQRVLVGQYGGLKVGSIDIAELTDESVGKLGAAMTKLQEESASTLKSTKDEITELQARLERLSGDSQALDSELSNSLATITARVAGVEQQLKDRQNDRR
jgi:hypothetical protein